MLLAVAGLLMVYCLIAFGLLARRGQSRYLVVTAFMIFGGMEIISLWPATLSAYYQSVSYDAFPVFLVALGFSAFLVGYTVVEAYGVGSRGTVSQFKKRPFGNGHPDSYYLGGVFLSTVVLLALGLYLYRGVPPILEMFLSIARGKMSLSNVASYMSYTRFLITKSYLFGGEYRGQGLIRTVMAVGWPYLLCVSILRIKQTDKRRWLWFGISVILLIASFVFISGDGTRSPFIFAMLYVITFLTMYFDVKLRSVIAFLLIVFIAVLGLSMLSNKGSSWMQQSNPIITGVLALQNRIGQNGMNDVYAIELVRSGEISYYLGSIQAQQFLNALPGIRFGGTDFSHELASLMLPYQSATTTFASMTYLGTVFVDFGILGVVSIFTLIGALIAFSQRRIFLLKKSEMSAPLLAFLMFYLGYIAIGGLVILLAKGVVVIAFYLLFRVSAEVLSGHVVQSRSRDALTTAFVQNRDLRRE